MFEEPVSAYSVFKAAKDSSKGNKKSKNKQNKKNSRNGKAKSINCSTAEQYSEKARKLRNTNGIGQSKLKKNKIKHKSSSKNLKLQGKFENKLQSQVGMEESDGPVQFQKDKQMQQEQHVIETLSMTNTSLSDENCSSVPNTSAGDISRKRKLKKVQESKLRKTLVQHESEPSEQSEHKDTSSDTTKEIGEKFLNTLNSVEEGEKTFQWLLNPVTVKNFFDSYWEHNACYIKRNLPKYFSHLISMKSINQMLLDNHVEFTKNVDVTSYENGVRKTLNPEGRALPPLVWLYYNDGCSVRLINPQTFLPELYTICTTMQEYFHCYVGANVYLTPPNSQGFAPHYDDIDAFVLQIEGQKNWKMYKARNSSEILPRDSSKDFSQEEIGKPVFEQTLSPGDVLYFPRGTIHQASTVPGSHSLHITLSVFQKQSYADLFEKMLPVMLEKAIASNVNLRRSLPLDVWQNAGIAFNNVDTKERMVFMNTVASLLQAITDTVPFEEIVDDSVDQLAKKFQHQALPPKILPEEKSRTVFGSTCYFNKIGECVWDYDITDNTYIRLLRANIMRCVADEGKLRLYYYLENSKEYCEHVPNYIEIEEKHSSSIYTLIRNYPEYMSVSQLPLPIEEGIDLVTALWERGLLMMKNPFSLNRMNKDLCNLRE